MLGTTNKHRRHRTALRSTRRRGAAVILAVFLMAVLVSMMALSIDVGYIAASKSEARRTTDAAALAGCWQMLDSIGQNVPSDQLPSKVNTAVNQLAQMNSVCNNAPTFTSSGQDTDISIGYLASLDPNAPLVSSSNNPFRAVKVRLRKQESINGQVPLYFARFFGLQGRDMTVESTAAMATQIKGFNAPIGGIGGLDILPFAIDQQTWDSLQNGGGSDNYKYNTCTSTSCNSGCSSGSNHSNNCHSGSNCGGSNNCGSGNSSGNCGSGGSSGNCNSGSNCNSSVTNGCDGIREVNLYPQGTGSPGNRGTVDIGNSNNSTADICRQITDGVSAKDLQDLGKPLVLGANGTLTLKGDTGISAGVKDELESIIGQTRIIPVFSSVSGNGNNATYTIVRWVGVRIMAVKLTGAMNSKYLIVQPATVVVRNVVAGDNSRVWSDSMYSPVVLVK